MYTDLVFIGDLGLLSQASRILTIDALVLARMFAQPKDATALREQAKALGIPFKTCHLMQKDDSQELRRFENAADLIAVRGTSPRTNKFAAASKRIDILLQPFDAGKLTFDTAIARLCTENKTAVAFLLSDFLNTSRHQRAALFRNALFVAKLCRKFKVNCLFFSGASRAEELCSPQNLSGFAALLGFPQEEAMRCTKRLPLEALGLGD